MVKIDDHEPHTSKNLSGVVEHERHWRLIMDSSEFETADRMFRDALDFRFSSDYNHPTRVFKAWDFATGIDYRHGNLPSRIYLNHPIRVATTIAREVPNVTEETLIIGLLHNVIEVSQVSSSEIRALFGSNVISAIQALTVDRNRRDKGYLEEYYSRIEATSIECAIVKVVDKLDNIYMVCFIPSEETRLLYLDEIEDWVIPLASRVIPQIGIRIRDATTVMREIGFLSRDAELENAKRRT